MHDEHINNHRTPEDPRNKDVINAFHDVFRKIVGHDQSKVIYDWEKHGVGDMSDIPTKDYNKTNFPPEALGKIEGAPQSLKNAITEAANSDSLNNKEKAIALTRQDKQEIEWLDTPGLTGAQILKAIPKKKTPTQE